MRILNGPPRGIPQAILNSIKITVCVLAAPFLLIAVLAAFVCAVLDFTWFRTHAIALGSPQPKGLWEF